MLLLSPIIIWLAEILFFYEYMTKIYLRVSKETSQECLGPTMALIYVTIRPLMLIDGIQEVTLHPILK